MNWLILVIGISLISLSVSEKYTDRYDDINVNEILGNRRLLMPYIKCTLNQGRCTPEGKELKIHIQDAMQTGCSKCTEAQKQMAKQVVKHLRDNEQETWEQLKSKYDPGDKYKDIYEAFLASED